ncbi:IclR family transcriptional regulator [Paraburkholderia guartelaensis]|uniref:IclR family transcriptional regulator n=1 Tax=Paraburkholderia guartelaensis TaxID=2546446 RepID=UPI002AB7CE5B|nr:helix-turn-helix domain-containing protein [Paraburkholderia guartelaensis]
MPLSQQSQRPQTEPAVRGAQSIERAAQLLRLLGQHHVNGVSLQTLTDVSGLDRTTTYRIVTALVEAGLAVRNPQTKLYRLGVESMALGTVSMQAPPLVEQFLPMMKQLARQTGEHVFLVVRSGDYSHCLHVEEGETPSPEFVKNRNRMRLLGMGIPSIALLAELPDEEISAHYARHANEYGHRNLDEPRLRRWVRQTRELGYAQVAAQGLSGVGVSFPMGSCATAAIGIVTVASKMPRGHGAALAALSRRHLESVVRYTEPGAPSR